MTNEASRVFRFLRFVIPSFFVLRLPRRSPAKAGHSSFSGNERGDRKTSRTGADTSVIPEAFTILELLVVIGIIIVLAGLILATVGYVQKKGARSRAEAEIAAISAALESYRADNGIYPRSANTDTLKSTTNGDPNSYLAACQYLYGEITGDRDFDGSTDSGSKSYFTLKVSSLLRPNMSNPPSSSNKVSAIRDPFGYSYGYSTAYQYDIDHGTNPPTDGYNPTFDLWSTAGETAKQSSETFQQYQQRWVKNW
jgi:type II secretory pathway pseudopilin PulG